MTEFELFKLFSLFKFQKAPPPSGIQDVLDWASRLYCNLSKVITLKNKTLKNLNNLNNIENLNVLNNLKEYDRIQVI